MIKAENFPKIRKNPRNFPEKTLKISRVLGEGGPASPDRGGFANFFDDRGFG